MNRIKESARTFGKGAKGFLSEYGLLLAWVVYWLVGAVILSRGG